MKQLLSILPALVALSVYGQKATVESVAADPLNIAAAKYPMTDLNGNKAPLVVDGLPAGTHNVTITVNGTLIALDGSLAPTFAQDVNYERFQSNDKYGFKDRNGKIVIPAMYESAFNFSEGLAAVLTNGKWGFIDKNNQLVIPAMYDDARWFKEGKAAVKTNGKRGFIDKNNQLVIPAMYDTVESFENGNAKVELNGRWVTIDKTGKVVE